MNKSIILLIAFTVVYIRGFAQGPDIEWQKSFGGSQNEYSQGGIEIDGGGFFFVGYSLSNDGDVYNNHGDFDLFLIKTDVHGDTVWTKTFGGTELDGGRRIAYFNNDYYICSSTYSSDGDIHEYTGESDFWMLKINENGDTIFSQCYGGSMDEFSTDIIKTSDGGFLITGCSESGNLDIPGNYGIYDAVILKLDKDGNLIWIKHYGGSYYDTILNAIQTSDDGFLIIGYTSSSDIDITENKGLNDIMILKVDSMGNLIWSKTYGGSLNEYGWDLVEVADSVYYLIGYTESADGDIVENHGSYDAWVLKINFFGDTLWTGTFGGSGNDRITSILLMPNNELSVFGYSTSSDGDIDFNNGNSDLWVFQINQSGDIVWSKTYGGSGIELGYSSFLYSDGSIMMIGNSESNDGDVTSNNGMADFWIVKLESEFQGIEEVTKNVKIYPNPVNDYLYIDYDKEFYYSIYNITGELIDKNICIGEVDVSALNSGLYLFNLFKKDGTILCSNKIIKL